MNKGNISWSVGRLIVTLIMLAIVVAGGTFAWFTYSSRQSALVLTIGLLASIAYYKVSYIIILLCSVLYLLDFVLTIIFLSKNKFDKRFLK